MTHRTIIIGDIHGCIDELEALLMACGREPRDEVVCVGDLIGKGPASCDVLNLCRSTGIKSVMGNHDYALIDYFGARQAGQQHKMRPGHLALAQLLTAQDWQYLRALPLYIELPPHKAIVVHAGLVPGLSLTAQPAELLMNIRTLTATGQGSRRPDAGPLWASRYDGPRFVFFGHHARAGLQQHPNAIGLDTGCVYGGRLTACILPERRLVSVPARKTYTATGS